MFGGPQVKHILDGYLFYYLSIYHNFASLGVAIASGSPTKEKQLPNYSDWAFRATNTLYIINVSSPDISTSE